MSRSHKSRGRLLPRSLGRVMNKHDRQLEHQRRRRALKRQKPGSEQKWEPTWHRWDWWAYS